MARALSPLLSTMILLSAALVAGILLYTYFSATLASMARTPNPVVQQAIYYPQLSLLHVEIKNMGGAPVPINGSEIRVYAGNRAICVYKIVCSTQATGSSGLIASAHAGIALHPSATLTIEVSLLNSYNMTSLDVCVVKLAEDSPSDPAECAAGLATQGGYVVFAYRYAGGMQTTQPTQVTIG